MSDINDNINTEDSNYLTKVGGMYKEWFLDYASYVILERAVPDLMDGLKPVQRRILHSMFDLEDGRYNKVANIVGHTMQYHPHGDASISDAIVQVGQKELLIDMQGNWGNIYTGDRAAASRYIEARLSKFALEVVFNPKTTNWQLSYDGRKKEPIHLPVKFPLLLAQGAEGIAVGLSTKILPHNFNELIDGSVKYLKGRSFKLFPDFQTGGSIDVSNYNDGNRGGRVKVRATVEKYDKNTIIIKEIPYGTTTASLIESIIKASEKGKVKIKKIEDNTSADVDGMHIRLLIITFFLQFFPELIKNGHLYILQTPIFRVRNKEKTHYCYSESEKNEILNSSNGKFEITRFKGLGEISPDEFKNFIGDDMRLDPVVIDHSTTIENLLSFYMGKNTPDRQQFIIENLKVELDLLNDNSDE